MDEEHKHTEKEELEADSQMMIGNPSTPPPEDFMNELRNAMEDEFDIAAAFVFLMGSSDRTPSITIGVQLEMPQTQEYMEALSEKIIARVQPFYPNQQLAMMELADPELLATIKEFTQPFYYK